MEARNTVANMPVACDSGTETDDSTGKVVTGIVGCALYLCWEEVGEDAGDLPIFWIGGGDDDLDEKMAWRRGSREC